MSRVETFISFLLRGRKRQPKGSEVWKMMPVLFLAFCLASHARAAYPEELWHFDLPTPSLNSAAAADIDGDGKLEVVFGTYYDDGTLYALNAEDGSLLWQFKTEPPLDASLSIADVVADNPGPEILFASSVFGGFHCLDGNDGQEMWFYAPSWLDGTDSPPAVGDIDSDGKAEVVFGSFTGRLYALNAEDGSECWVRKIGSEYINSDPGLVDLDGDHTLEIVFSTHYLSDTAANKVLAVNGEDGVRIWSYDAPKHCMYHGCAFADLDKDGKPEFVVKDASETLYWVAADGSEYLPPRKLSSSYFNNVVPPVSIGDLNGDGDLEVVAFSDTLFCFSSQGEVLWQQPVSFSDRGASLADINADGKLDLVFCTYEGELTALSGADGSEIWSFDAREEYGKDLLIIHPPIIADFNQDGKLDVFFAGGWPWTPQYGRAWALAAGEGSGPGWTKFRHDLYNSGCFEHPYSEVRDEKTNPGDLILMNVPVISDNEITISYQIPTALQTTLEIFDASGRLVAVLVNSRQPPGEHRVNWSTQGLNAGVYFCRLETNEASRSAKIVLVK